MLRKRIELLLIICFALTLLISCNSGKQKKGLETVEQYDQYVPSAENQNMITLENLAKDEEILKKDSLNIEMRIRLASSYYTINETLRAIDHFLVVHKIDEKNLTALIALGNLYMDTKQNGRAIEFYEKALEQDSLNLNVRCDMGTCYKRLEMFEKAIQIWKNIIEINYNHAVSHYNLYIVYNKIDNHKEAEKEKRIFDKIVSEKKK